MKFSEYVHDLTGWATPALLRHMDKLAGASNKMLCETNDDLGRQLTEVRHEKSKVDTDLAAADRVIADLKKALEKSENRHKSLLTNPREIMAVIGPRLKMTNGDLRAFFSELQGFKPMSSVPRVGRPINVRQLVTMRFQPYHPESNQARKGAKGRWQSWNGKTFLNCQPPKADGWKPVKGENDDHIEVTHVDR